MRRREMGMEASYWLELTLPFLGVTWQAAQLLERANQPSYSTLTRHSVDELVRLLVATENREENEHKIYIHCCILVLCRGKHEYIQNSQLKGVKAFV